MSRKNDGQGRDVIHLHVGDGAIVFRPGADPTIYVSEPSVDDEYTVEVQNDIAFIIYALNNPLFREMFYRSQGDEAMN